MLAGCSAGSYLGLGSSGGDAPAVAVQDSTGSTGATSISLTRAKPLDAYVAIGGDIKRCWFNPVDGLLPKHVYRADVSPDGSKVQISVHQKIELGRAGMTTYVIDFKQSGPSTVITTENRTMPPRPRRQDAVRPRPLEAGAVGLQQGDADHGLGCSGQASRNRPVSRVFAIGGDACRFSGSRAGPDVGLLQTSSSR